MTFLFAWNTKQSIAPFINTHQIAHAKSLGTTTSLNSNSVKHNKASSSSDNDNDDDGCQVKQSVTPYIAVAATASFLLGKKIVLKKLDNGENENDEGLDGNERKFDEIMTSFRSPPSSSSSSSSSSSQRTPSSNDDCIKQELELSTQKTKKPSFDEEAIQKTEEAEHVSFTLAAAEKAVADVIKEENKIDNSTTNSDSNLERREAEQFVAVALKEYEETMEKVGIIEEHEIDDNVSTSIGDGTDDNLNMSVETHEEKIANARKQPKSPEEERELSQKYAAMSLEERAFTILLDLGMIDMTPDPDDPSYDSSQDDDFCPENRFDSF